MWERHQDQSERHQNRPTWATPSEEVCRIRASAATVLRSVPIPGTDEHGHAANLPCFDYVATEKLADRQMSHSAMSRSVTTIVGVRAVANHLRSSRLADRCRILVSCEQPNFVAKLETLETTGSAAGWKSQEPLSLFLDQSCRAGQFHQLFAQASSDQPGLHRGGLQNPSHRSNSALTAPVPGTDAMSTGMLRTCLVSMTSRLGGLQTAGCHTALCQGRSQCCAVIGARDGSRPCLCSSTAGISGNILATTVHSGESRSCTCEI